MTEKQEILQLRNEIELLSNVIVDCLVRKDARVSHYIYNGQEEEYINDIYVGHRSKYDFSNKKNTILKKVISPLFKEFGMEV